jgi:hypothetical protein
VKPAPAHSSCRSRGDRVGFDAHADLADRPAVQQERDLAPGGQAERAALERRDLASGQRFGLGADMLPDQRGLGMGVADALVVGDDHEQHVDPLPYGLGVFLNLRGGVVRRHVLDDHLVCGHGPGDGQRALLVLRLQFAVEQPGDQREPGHGHHKEYRDLCEHRLGSETGVQSWHSPKIRRDVAQNTTSNTSKTPNKRTTRIMNTRLVTRITAT